MKKIIFLLFVFLNISNAAYADWCKKDCSSKCVENESVAFGKIDKGKICNNDLTDIGFGNAKIGWEKNCAVPGGELYPSQWSCISTGNVIGQVFDTIFTLGVAIDMRNNFCSFSPGDQKLEGAIINRKLLRDYCNESPYNSTAEAQHNCISCVLNGKKPNPPGSRTKCEEPNSNHPDPLGLNSYTSNTSICDGIPNLEKPVLDDDNKQVYADNNGNKVSADNPNGKAVYCPIMRCNIPTNNIRTKYYDDSFYRTIIMTFLTTPIGGAVSLLAGDCCDMSTLTDKEEKNVALWQIVQIKGDLNGDRMCSKMYFGLGGWTQLACKPSIPPEIEFPGNNACFVEKSALTTGEFHSQWILPMSSKVIEVTTDIFNNMFFDSSSCQNGLTEFQHSMKDIVRILLILYVIIFGFRLATGSERITKRDFFIFILKFALVIYFSVGTLEIKKPTSPDQAENGLMLLKDIALDGMTSLSNMVMEAGVAQEKLCNFSNVTYTKGYSYLKMWDTLDCKIAFYLGLAQPTKAGAKVFDSGLGVVQLAAGLFSLMWTLLSSFKILLLVFLFAFGIFLISLVVYFTHLYIIAMIAVTIMIFFGPIFVPLALFDETKNYFDSWLRILSGYALQPVIVVAAISFMVLTFDQVIYSDCKFTQIDLHTIAKPYWTFNNDDPTAQSDTCKKSFGYILSNFAVGKYYKETSTQNNGETVVKYNAATPEENFVDILNALMLCTFFAFLFYYFANQLGGLATELSGAPDLGGQAIGATAVMDTAATATAKKAGTAAGAGINVATQGKGGKIVEGVQVATQAARGTAREGEGMSVSVGSMKGKGGADTLAERTGDAALEGAKEGSSVGGKGSTPKK